VREIRWARRSIVAGLLLFIDDFQAPCMQGAHLLKQETREVWGASAADCAAAGRIIEEKIFFEATCAAMDGFALSRPAVRAVQCEVIARSDGRDRQVPISLL
jgi:hypothetical protein